MRSRRKQDQQGGKHEIKEETELTGRTVGMTMINNKIREETSVDREKTLKNH